MSWLTLHRDIRTRLRSGMSRAQAHRELASRYPEKDLLRALREYPEPERLARFVPLNRALQGLLVFALAMKALVLALLVPSMLEVGVSPVFLLLTPLPVALLFAFAIYGIRHGMGMSYRAAAFMGMWTLIQLMVGNRGAEGAYFWVDVGFGALVAALALFLHFRLLERDHVYAPADASA